MLLRKFVLGHNFAASDWTVMKLCMIVSPIYDIEMTLGKTIAHPKIKVKRTFFFFGGGGGGRGVGGGWC